MILYIIYVACPGTLNMYEGDKKNKDNLTNLIDGNVQFVHNSVVVIGRLMAKQPFFVELKKCIIFFIFVFRVHVHTCIFKR